MSYENVECLRCGNKWYSSKLEEKKEPPKYCTKCYQESVREIPPPPTKIDKLKKNLRNKRQKIPVIIEEKKHDLTIWREQNRFLISLIGTGILISLVISAIVYALFFL